MFISTNPCRTIYLVNYTGSNQLVFHLQTTPLEKDMPRHRDTAREQAIQHPNYCLRYTTEEKEKAALIAALPDLADHKVCPNSKLTIQIWNSPSLGRQIRTMNGFPPSW